MYLVSNISASVMCPGYTGGPLVCGGRLAGLQSYSFSCGTAAAPSVYSDIAATRDWLDFILAQYEDED